MKPFISVVLVVLSAVAAHGQSGQPKTSFEVADVRVSPSSAPFMTGGVLREARYEIHSASMVDLVRIAYGLDGDDKVVGGPPWLATKRFDIVAKAPAGSTTESVRRMLQSLLADRFGLAIHNDSKPLSSFALTVGKRKLQLKEAAATADSGCQGNPQRSEAGIVLYQVLTCRNMSMATLAENLPNFAGAYVTSRVIDQTELKGAWDFELKWTPRATLVAAGSDGITLSEGLERVGLHLEAQSAATAVIVVDRVNDKPTGNIPDIEKSLPPPPTEFEVAVIKLSAPEVTQPRGGIQPGGRIDVQGMTLQALVTLAWDVTPEMIVNAPKWFDSDRFDMIAKAPTAAPVGANGAPTDIESLRAMLRGLLADRFKLVTHNENREVNVYALSAPKSETKLKKADASSRSECKRGGVIASNPALTNSFTCTNTTMAQLAGQLRNWAPAYIDRPTVDLTALEGGWDFVLAWTPKGALGVGTADRPGDPSGGLTIFEAVDRLLGLKLAGQKHSMKVLVIDRVEQKPTNN